VEVSFYNVARCLSIVFNVIFSYFLLGSQTHPVVTCTLGLVIIGFYIGIDGEVNFSFIGTLCGVVASLFVCFNGIYVAKVLPFVDGDKSQLLFYNNVNACFLFLPLISLFEITTLSEHSDKLVSGFFWLAMSLTGVMGFAIGLVTVMQVKATSPLSHNMSGTAKAAAQSLMAFYIWGNEATFKSVAGILIVLTGSGLYTWAQMSYKLPAAKELPRRVHTSVSEKA
jgi:GDP-fucose transporter C1